MFRKLAAIMFCALCGPFAFAGPDEAPAATHGRFHNNYPEPPPQSFWLWKWEQWRQGLPKPPPEGWQVPRVATDTAFLRANKTQPTVTWIGHSSFLVQLAGLNVLFDPQFSERASPVAFAGPKRFAPLPFAIGELPHVDVVAISHNHYDHLDVATVRALAAQEGGSPLFLVPSALSGWFRDVGVTKVTELAWWQTHDAAALRFTLVPVQHWSKRTLTDTNETLWGGWVLEGAGLKVIHTGDLGYSKDTQDIGERLGPFDFAMIPIGAYAPRWFMKAHHVDVAEALQVRRELRAARAVGMHWGTFEGLTDESLDEPPRRLAEQRREAGLAPADFDVMKIGETRPIEALRGGRTP